MIKLKLRKIIRKGPPPQLAVAREKTRQAARIRWTPRPFCQSAGQRQLRDVRIAQHFEFGLGKLLAGKSREGRERQDEITNGAACRITHLGLQRSAREIYTGRGKAKSNHAAPIFAQSHAFLKTVKPSARTNQHQQAALSASRRRR